MESDSRIHIKHTHKHSVLHNILQAHSWKDMCTIQHHALKPHVLILRTTVVGQHKWTTGHSDSHTSSPTKKGGLICTHWQNILFNLVPALSIHVFVFLYLLIWKSVTPWARQRKGWMGPSSLFKQWQTCTHTHWPKYTHKYYAGRGDCRPQILSRQNKKRLS